MLILCYPNTRLGNDYPAQEKPPPDPQLPPKEAEPPDELLPNEAAAEIFLCVSVLPQTGQGGKRSASEKRTIFSKSSAQFWQWYSYKGMFL
jgi:hypothetical protein